MNKYLCNCLLFLITSFKPSQTAPSDKINWMIRASNEIAIRKLEELNRETVDQVNYEFLNRTMEKAREQRGCINWYQAMQDVVFRNASYLKIGVPPLTEFTTTMRRVMNATKFFETVVGKNWQNGSGTFESWVLNVTNGEPIPGSMMKDSDDVIVAYSFSWWSPDARLNMPTSSSVEQGNQDFLNVCKILSLAPEWYPYGFVSIEYQPEQPQDVFARPSTYNGLTSPLWVQHPENVSAKTGGGASETILLPSLLLKDIVAKTTDDEEVVPYVRLYPVTPEMTDALLKSPSVFEYSVNAKKTSSEKMLGDQQKEIIEEVENKRKVLAPQFKWKEMDKEIQALIDIITAQPPCSDSTHSVSSMHMWHSSIELYLISVMIVWKLT